MSEHRKNSILRYAALAVSLTIAATSSAQPKAGLNETNLLEPVTRFELGLWRLKQLIEHNRPEYTATIYMANDRLNVFVNIGVDGPLPEPADKACAVLLLSVQGTLADLEKAFAPPWWVEPWRSPPPMDPASTAERYAVEQKTLAYLRKLGHEADVVVIFKRNAEFGADAKKIVIHDESYSCEVPGGDPKPDVIFKRLK